MSHANNSSIAQWLLPSDMKRRLWPLLIGLGYIAIIAVLGGLRSDHVVIGMLCLLDYYNEKSRLFLRFFFPFILTGVVFDSMRYFYWQGIAGHVHVQEPFFRDLKWFGINTVKDGHKVRLTLNQYFELHHTVFLDLVTGVAYLVFVGEYLCTAFYLFWKEHWRALWVFGWCFLIDNTMGYITYFIYPAAPPWYVNQYGLGPARMDVHPESAAAHRFDQILGTHFFDQVYSRGIDVYGAYPSLHVSYPLLVVWVTFLLPELKWFRAPAIVFYLLMCFSALYLQHHYMVDVLLGSAYAVIVAMGATKILSHKGIERHEYGNSSSDRSVGICGIKSDEASVR